ncbi:MAG TPA: DUF3592 domain-containing protein [Propionibacteriaceae bacterium]|nr:DUF3592 domain-containing protein [Propionibacteriaceae bacterium]
MKVLKILGIVFGILLLLTAGGLAVGSVAANKGQAAVDQELAKTGYAGPVEGTVRSVDQTNPVTVTVTYADAQGKTQTGRGAVAGGNPPQVGDTVSTYYSTSDPRQVVVVNVPGIGDLSGIADTLRTVAIICLITGSLLLLAGILGLALGRKQPASVVPGPAYPAVPRSSRQPDIRPSPIRSSSRRPVSNIRPSSRTVSSTHRSSTHRSDCRSTRQLGQDLI